MSESKPRKIWFASSSTFTKRLGSFKEEPGFRQDSAFCVPSAIISECAELRKHPSLPSQLSVKFRLVLPRWSGFSGSFGRAATHQETSHTNRYGTVSNWRQSAAQSLALRVVHPRLPRRYPVQLCMSFIDQPTQIPKPYDLFFLEQRAYSQVN